MGPPTSSQRPLGPTLRVCVMLCVTRLGCGHLEGPGCGRDRGGAVPAPSGSKGDSGGHTGRDKSAHGEEGLGAPGSVNEDGGARPLREAL